MKKFIAVFFMFMIMLFSSVVYAIDDVPAIDQDTYEDEWGVDNICGPTVASEIIGYWGAHGYPNLSSDMDEVLWDMISTYIVRTSSGATYPASLITGIEEYAWDAGYEFEVTTTGKGKTSWSGLKAEIDAGRPVILLNYAWNHYVVVIDYYESGTTRTIDILYGHIPLKRTINVATLILSKLQTFYIVPITPPDNGVIIEDPDPSTEDWYEEVITWCEENDWELEPED
jgi:hypothetical protein